MLIDPIHLKFGEKLKDKFFAHVIGKTELPPIWR